MMTSHSNEEVQKLIDDIKANLHSANISIVALTRLGYKVSVDAYDKYALEDGSISEQWPEENVHCNHLAALHSVCKTHIVYKRTNDEDSSN